MNPDLIARSESVLGFRMQQSHLSILTKSPMEIRTSHFNVLLAMANSSQVSHKAQLGILI